MTAFPDRPLGRDDLFGVFRAAIDALAPARVRRVMLACSGGPDSMALWDLLERWRRRTGVELIVAHVDHRLRGAGSRADRDFVVRTARRWNTPCRTAAGHARRLARHRGKGVEEAARRLRYSLLARMARRANCRVVLTAHSLDDRVETFFINLIRGAGPRGLSAMAADAAWPTENGRGLRLLRPLLGVRRRALRTYLRRRRIPFRDDPTNRDPVHFRNRIRPVLQSWDRMRPGFFERVARTADILREEEAAWERLLVGRSSTKPRRGVLDVDRLLSYDKSIQRRLLAGLAPAATFAQIERLRAFAAQPDPPPRGALVLPEGRFELDGGRLRRRPGNPVPSRLLSISLPRFNGTAPRDDLSVAVPGKTRLTRWLLKARIVKRLPRGWKRNPRRVFVDLDRLDPSTLRWRTWRPGDRFQPLGLDGHKKLQDFFVDERVPLAERTDVPLLVNREGIVWVVGRRLAEGVKLTRATRRIAELRIDPMKPRHR